MIIGFDLFWFNSNFWRNRFIELSSELGAPILDRGKNILHFGIFRLGLSNFWIGAWFPFVYSSLLCTSLQFTIYNTGPPNASELVCNLKRNAWIFYIFVSRKLWTCTLYIAYHVRNVSIPPPPTLSDWKIFCL